MDGTCDSPEMTAQFYAVRKNGELQRDQAGAQQGRDGCEDPGEQAEDKSRGFLG